MSRVQTKSFDFSVKSIDEQKGKFSGYASVFGVVDFANEVVEKGAFEKSLEQLKAQGRTIPVLWQHNPDYPIGNWDDLKEDGVGLAGDASLWLEEAPHAKLAYRGLSTKALSGLSIGYHVDRSSVDQKSGVRTLHEIDLREVSIVTNPCLDVARVASVKSIVEGGDLPTLKEFEKYLREAGFSKSQATAIASGGLVKLLRSESERTEAAMVKSLADTLSKFELDWSK